MKKSNWEEINNALQSVSFSVMGCTLPKNLDENVRETLELVFNRIYLNPRDEEFIKVSLVIGGNASDDELLLTSEQISILENIINYVTRDEIISRIGDVLWVLKKDYKAAQKATESHRNLFEKAKKLDEIRQSEAVINALIAFNLMMQLGQKNEAINFMTNIIDDSIADKNGFFCDNFLDHLVIKEKFKLLLSGKKVIYKGYLREKANNDCSADFAGNLLVKIAQKENDVAAEKEAYLLIAASWENMSKTPGIHQMQRASAMSKASDYYKKGEDEESANRCIIEAQKSLQDQSGWTSLSYPVNLKPLIDAYEPQFNSAANINEKICLITNFTKIKYDSVVEQHNSNKSNNPFYGAFHEQSIDENGVVRSNRKGFGSKDEQREEPHLISLATQYINFQAYIVNNFNHQYVLPEISKVTFSEIIKPLLPENVLMIDYILQMVLSYHSEIVVESLLIAFETFLAALLENNGISSIKQMDSGNMQEDLTMGPMVAECKKHGLIDKDDAFLIEALLCNKHGMNLRNLSSHRLTPDSKRSNAAYLFCGYFLIRLLLQYSDNSTNQTETAIKENL